MTAYMGCIGDDAFGRRLQQACEEDGVATRPGMWELQTGCKVLLGGDGWEVVGLGCVDGGPSAAQVPH